MRLTTLHLFVSAFVWREQSRLGEFDLEQNRLAHFRDCPVIGLDYHQVLDVDRGSRWNADRVTDSGILPRRHRNTISELRDLIENLRSPVKIVLVRHIESSSRNRENLLTAVVNSGLSVDLVLITTTRIGDGNWIH